MAKFSPEIIIGCSELAVAIGGTLFVSFDTWTGGRSISTIGSNAGAANIPFQNWRRFKEAFPPEFVAHAIRESKRPVRRCLDPFGGSGTTALACQFLGVHPTTIEVNPFLADLIEAKLATYVATDVARSFAELVRSANRQRINPRELYAFGPETLIEPGVDGRWIFDRKVAARLAAYVTALPMITNKIHRRLFRVILGGVIVDVSNVVVSGKGRRYRNHWHGTRRDGNALDDAFCAAMESAISDIVRFNPRQVDTFAILRGDALRLIPSTGPADISIFSPPYPNSFDYTDVYNVELWALRYLKSWQDNKRLRMSTLESHVQVKRKYASPPATSASLNQVLRHLTANSEQLWDKHIPAMIGGYFANIDVVLKRIRTRLHKNGQIWMVVGDSRYVGITIPVAQIISELAHAEKFLRVVKSERFRSMKAAVQQGRNEELGETLIVLQKL